MQLSDADQIARNVAVHDRVARKYERLHGEIFNDVEQKRLAAFLNSARTAIRSDRTPARALDFGCGSGNLTRHLLDLSLEVTAADVSQRFLDLVTDRYRTQPVATLLMNGIDLAQIPDDSFELVAAYSVLHHVPDYLGAVAEFVRVCAPGGVIAIDHELNESFWRGDPVYAELQRKGLRLDWHKYLHPPNYVHRVRRIFNPRHSNEGDIHVWPDDHIEWDRIRALLSRGGFEVAAEEDYLLYRRLYRREVYDVYAGRCTDMKGMIFRKCDS